MDPLAITAPIEPRRDHEVGTWRSWTPLTGLYEVRYCRFVRHNKLEVVMAQSIIDPRLEHVEPGQTNTLGTKNLFQISQTEVYFYFEAIYKKQIGEAVNKSELNPLND